MDSLLDVPRCDQCGVFVGEARIVMSNRLCKKCARRQQVAGFPKKIPRSITICGARSNIEGQGSGIENDLIAQAEGASQIEGERDKMDPMSGRGQDQGPEDELTAKAKEASEREDKREERNPMLGRSPGLSMRGRDISAHHFWNENWTDFTKRFDSKHRHKDPDMLEMEGGCTDTTALESDAAFESAETGTAAAEWGTDQSSSSSEEGSDSDEALETYREIDAMDLEETAHQERDTDNRTRSLVGECCRNCNREGIARVESDPPELEVSLCRYRLKGLCMRHCWKSFTRSSVSRKVDYVTLCDQCYKVLEKPERGTKNRFRRDFSQIWPVYVWKLLTDESLVGRYGGDCIHFIPRSWWKYYKRQLSVALPQHYNDESWQCYSDSPVLVHDRTVDRRAFKKILANRRLGELKKGCDTYLRACVLCPWGCAGFLHDAGCVSFDSVICRFFPSLSIAGRLSRQNLRDRLQSCRSDYFSFEIDTHLFNPEWPVTVSIMFDAVLGPVFLTCDEHHGGTLEKYFHLPKTGNSLPSMQGDQLSHVVLRARTLRPAQARLYSNMYQMNLFQGTYSGVDSTWVSDVFRRFDFHSHLSDLTECRSYRYREDIRGLTHRLASEGAMDADFVETLRERSKELFPDETGAGFRSAGATVMTLSDVMNLQKSISGPISREVRIGDMRSNSFKTFTQAWPSHLVRVHCHDRYGASMIRVSAMRLKGEQDSRMLWFLCHAMCSIGALWETINDNLLCTDQWHGHLMRYIAQSFLKACPKIRDFHHPFYLRRDSPLRTAHGLASMLDSHCGNGTGRCSLGGLRILFAKEISDSQLLMLKFRYMDALLVEEECNLLWFVNYDRRSDIKEVPEEIDVGDGRFELRFLGGSSDSPTDQVDGWRGCCWMRHGTSMFPGWWSVDRSRSHAQSVQRTGLAEFPWDNLDMAIYVRRRPVDLEQYRLEYMKYIGGQTHVTCHTHDTPLIAAPPSKTFAVGSCCRSKPSSGDRSFALCGRGVGYHCPVDGCWVGICSACFSALDGENTAIVRPDAESLGTPLEDTSLGWDQQAADAEDLHSSDESDQSTRVSVNSPRPSIGDSETWSSYESGAFSVASDDTVGDQFNCREVTGPVYDATDLPTGFGCVVGTGEADPCDPMDIDESPIISSTYAGGVGLPVTGKVTGIGTSVLLNKCGSMLVRRQDRLQASRRERNLLERVASQKDVGCVPLVYLEGILFPSVFYAMPHSSDGGILGSVPTALFCQHTTRRQYGIASLADHAKVRLKSVGNTASTDPRYLSFLFDSIANGAVEGHDTRIVLNRGFESCMGPAGMRMRGKDDDLYSDGIDNRQNVNFLCAAQRYRPSSLFVTFTCNQSKHFGIHFIKRYVDEGRALEAYKDYLQREFPSLGALSPRACKEVQRSLTEAARNLIVRHWLEVKKFILEYMLKSPEKPIGDVLELFARDEYQKESGNLPHIHLLATIRYDYNHPVGRAEIQKVVRGFIDDIVTEDEVAGLIEEGILDDYDDYYSVKADAQTFLPHYHTDRCLRRTGPGENDLVCRVPDRRLISDDIASFFESCLTLRHSKEALDILARLGLVVVDRDANVLPQRDFLNARRLHAPARRGEGCVTPVVGRMFAASRSSMNVQICTSHGTSRYVVKYVIKVDEGNYVVFSSKQGGAAVKAETVFLHNTKISSSKFNEEKRLKASRDSNRPRGRAVAATEMMQIILGKPQVMCNMEFIKVPTLPLGERPGVERVPPQDAYDGLELEGKNGELDSFDFMVPTVRYRMNNLSATWRLHTASQVMMLKDQMKSRVSLDRVFVFGVRPPELLCFDKMEWYFRYFQRSRRPVVDKDDGLDKLLSDSLEESAWIDGLGYRVRVRPKALPALAELLSDPGMRRSFRAANADSVLLQFDRMIRYYSEAGVTVGLELALVNLNRNSLLDWNRLQGLFVAHYDTGELPVIVFSNVRPHNACKFAIHLLLSMGRFQTERDLWINPSIQAAFVKAGLLPERNGLLAAEDVDGLLKWWIEDQLKNYPVGSNTLDQHVVSAHTILESILLHDTLPLNETPPVMYTSLVEHTSREIDRFLRESRTALISATLRILREAYMDHQHTQVDFPTKSELEGACKHSCLQWVPAPIKATCQSLKSHREQTLVHAELRRQVDGYRTPGALLPKNILIAGPPGVGKTHCMCVSMCYALSRGLCVMSTAVLAERAYILGGKHLHLLFKLRVRDKGTPHRLAELAVISLQKHPEMLVLLRRMDVLYVDECGQVCAELLAVLDIVLRKIRNSHLFMGGVLVIGTIDQAQLRPIKGLPFLLSPYVLTTFRIEVLRHYVRCGECPVLQHAHELARSLGSVSKAARTRRLKRLRELISDNCQFVETWDHPSITDEVLRVFPRREEAARAVGRFIENKKVEANRRGRPFRRVAARDYMIGMESHGDWKDATPGIAALLNKECREPAEIHLYEGAVFQFTYNRPGCFKATQLGVLLHVPQQESLDSFKSIQVYAAPPGMKTIGCALTEDALKAHLFTPVMVGCAPDRSRNFWRHGIKAKRQQYALKHHIASTVHGSIGHTVSKLATELSGSKSLWERAMVVVLISRVRRATDLIFVGSKSANLDSLLEGLKKQGQYDEYMDHVVNVLSATTCNPQPVLLGLHPFRYKDIALPMDRSGVVYLLVSQRDQGSLYIGRSQDMRLRMISHNSGYGSRGSAPVEKRPWGLYAYFTGFAGNKELMASVERKWQMAVHSVGPNTPREAVSLAERVVEREHNRERLVAVIADTE